MKKQYYSSLLFALLALLSLGNKLSAQDCSADFNALIDGPDVAFNGIATGLSPSYVWSFGDGTYAYTENTEHTYTVNGTYLVCFSVYAADSCFASYCDSILIEGAAGGDCNALFNFDAFGETAYFNNLSTPADVTSFWNFGDGATSMEDDPAHTFVPGTYEVCLTVYGVDSCTSDYCQVITIFEGVDSLGCSAYFSFDEFGGTVDFTNLSDDGGFAADYVWSFGDGSESFVENPTHTFDPGLFTVCLTIYTADSCSSTYCSTILIGGIIDTGACAAAFEYTVTGTLADFTNTSDGGGAFITGYNWDFGDGATATSANPEHNYSFSGSYNVCLTIFTSDSCSSTYCEVVYIFDGDTTDCNADFNYDFGITAWGIFTTNLSDAGGAAAEYLWDFGDGETSLDFEPVHEYTVGGTYLICLTITTPFCTDTYCETVIIAPTGIDESIIFNSLQVYPNPAKNNITISLKNETATAAIINITDLNGRLIANLFSGVLIAGEQTINADISNLAEGIYFIHITSETGENAVIKIVKTIE